MEEIDEEKKCVLRDINNVNGSQYIINNSIVEIKNDTSNSMATSLKVKEFERVDYLKLLNDYCSKKKIVYRKKVIDDINNILDEENQILLYGDPGIGKTTLINELSKDNDSIYISLRGKSLKRVLKYLIESIGISFDVKDDDDLLSVFESMLQVCCKRFFIDDCECDVKTFQEILNIEKFKNVFIYASRNKNIAGTYAVSNYEVKPFNEKEIIAFLSNEENSDIVNVIEFQELIKNSKGNPLYLYYYSIYQITPFPKDLLEYQIAIWNSVSSEEREIMSCITITDFPISMDVLKTSFEIITNSKKSPMQFLDSISQIEFLLKINENSYEIFHPSFKEFIVSELKKSGVLNYYKKVVGNVCFDCENYIEATLLLINIESKLIKPHLFYTAHILYAHGYLELSIKVFESALSIYNEDEESYEFAYINYHLSNIYKDLHNIEKSYQAIEQAIKYFSKCEDKEMYILSMTFKMNFMAEDGRKEEALSVLDILLHNMPEEPQYQAIIYINISKTYLGLNQYKLGAESAKKAIEIFSLLNDSRGIERSILNYSACLGQLNEEELALEYLEKLMDSKEVKKEPQLKAGILNNLTACYRKKGMFKEAKISCIQSIRICNRLKLEAKVVMNLLNLGNVYRDEREYDKCERVYLKGLEIAKKLNYKKEIGRAWELLANIYRIQKKFNEAIESATSAIEESSLVNDNFRVAEAYIERAYANKELGLLQEYVNDIDKAIINYLQEEFIDEAIYYLFRSFSIHYELNQLELAKKNIEILENILVNKVLSDYSKLQNNFEDLNGKIDKEKLLELNKILFEKYIESQSQINIVQNYIGFTSLCKQSIDNGGKDIFIEVTKKILDNLKHNKNLINVLAFGIEQSKDLLGFNELEQIVDKLQREIDGFYYRELYDGNGVITISWDCDIIIQINSHKTDLMQHKIAIALALIIKSNERFFYDKIKDSNINGIEFFVFDFLTYTNQIDNISEESFKEQMSAIFLISKDKDNPHIIILHKDYSEISDFNINDNNKAFVWILMILYTTIINHFDNDEMVVWKDDEQIAKESRMFVEEITGVNNNKTDKDKKWILDNII